MLAFVRIRSCSSVWLARPRISPNPPIRARCWDTSASIVQYAPEDEPNGADSEHLLDTASARPSRQHFKSCGTKLQLERQPAIRPMIVGTAVAVMHAARGRRRERTAASSAAMVRRASIE